MPQGFFFHVMAGREGPIDTAIKTAETGYIQHCLVKALKDIMVHYDGMKINTFSLNNEAFEHNYCVDIMDGKNGFPPNTLQISVYGSSLELQNDCHLLWEFVFPTADGLTPHYLPVNLHRIIQNATQIFHIDKQRLSDLKPSYIVEAVQQLNNCLGVVGDGLLTKEVQANASLAFCMHVHTTLATRRVLGEIEAKFNKSLVNPGEMCGTLAAQSIGEPAAQMMPDTFHYAGVSNKNMTLGVPWLKEIINITTKIKLPSLSIYLESDIAEETQGLLTKNVQQELAYTSLCTMAAAVEIWYDPDPSSTIIKEDTIFIESFFAIPNGEIESKLHLQLPWLLRLELDHTKMITSLPWIMSIKSKKEWVLEMVGINLKTVMCINNIDFTCMYSNTCIKVFNVLGIEAAHAAIMRELHGIIKFDSSYINYLLLALFVI
ncbi:hypothetical protein AZE42_11586 [Rhizopogon vesiculosus]|uniref:DNA-directed RNA polymerase n=1 Tax=Rhizopogon vesiculosus TaxID=180088 RepID=A0A1J8PMH0_9AGAM|nr:hypothetical protein AZE42_11586 [Rhizopogon vesiculosus]